MEKDFITFFINHLKKIFLNQDNKTVNNPEEQSKVIEKIQKDQDEEKELLEEKKEDNLIKINKKMTYQETDTVIDKKDEDRGTNIAFGNVSKILERKESKSSNFSKYSKDFQHQILKLEKENEAKDNLIKLFMSGLHKKIIFYNEKEKKEYPLMIPNEEIQFESIIKLFFIKYPTLNEKDGGTYTYKNKTMSLTDKIEMNENDKIIF